MSNKSSVAVDKFAEAYDTLKVVDGTIDGKYRVYYSANGIMFAVRTIVETGKQEFGYGLRFRAELTDTDDNVSPFSGAGNTLEDRITAVLGDKALQVYHYKSKKHASFVMGNAVVIKSSKNKKLVIDEAIDSFRDGIFKSMEKEGLNLIWKTSLICPNLTLKDISYFMFEVLRKELYLAYEVDENQKPEKAEVVTLNKESD